MASLYTDFNVKKHWHERVFVLKTKHHIIIKIPGLSPARMRIWQKWLFGEVTVIYNLFTCNVNFPLWRHYLGWQCDVINVKNFHEVLRYFFQILATPLTTTLTHRQPLRNFMSPWIYFYLPYGAEKNRGKVTNFRR